MCSGLAPLQPRRLRDKCPQQIWGEPGPTMGSVHIPSQTLGQFLEVPSETTGCSCEWASGSPITFRQISDTTFSLCLVFTVTQRLSSSLTTPTKDTFLNWITRALLSLARLSDRSLWSLPMTPPHGLSPRSLPVVSPYGPSPWPLPVAPPRGSPRAPPRNLSIVWAAECLPCQVKAPRGCTWMAPGLLNWSSRGC